MYRLNHTIKVCLYLLITSFFIIPIFADESKDLILEEISNSLDQTVDLSETQEDAVDFQQSGQTDIFLDESGNLKFAQYDEDMVLPIISFRKPEILISDSLDAFFINETEAILEELSVKNYIKYLPEEKWKFYHRLYNKEEKRDIAELYQRTEISGMVGILLEETAEGLLEIKVTLFNFFTKEETTHKYFIYEKFVIQQLSGYKNFFLKMIMSQLSPKKLSQLKKMKYEIPPYVRVNPDFEMTLSGGQGFLMKAISFESLNIYAYGTNYFFRFHSRIKRFSIETALDLAFLWNEKLEDTNLKTFTPVFGGFLSFNGWFRNQVFKLGFGGGVRRDRMYAIDKDYSNNTYEVIEYNYLLTFIYLSLSIQPNRKALMTLDIGSLFSPTHFTTILPAVSMPIYFRANLKYIIFKNMFIEFDIPFHSIGSREYDEDKGKYEINSQPYANICFYLGLGWRFEWNRRNP
ncbi:MAG: hypothetical protein MJB14_02035 [Spirochaetes bacterium]|nr:hypothetical protein [Spirochaetota bacterium]